MRWWCSTSKTDAPPPGITIAAYPEYGRQLEGYVEALRTSGLLDGHRVHAGLVFTGLACDPIAQSLEGFGEIGARQVPGELHAEMTSSRTIGAG